MEAVKSEKSVKNHGQGTDTLQVREGENRLGTDISAVTISWSGCWHEGRIWAQEAAV